MCASPETSAGTAGTATAGAGHSGSAGSSAAGGSAGGVGGGSEGTGAGGTKPANTTLPFTEDFEDGEANGFIAWNEDATQGMWVVVADGAGKVYQPAAAVSDLEFGVGGSTTWTDVALTVKVRLKDDTAGAQILLRFKDPQAVADESVLSGLASLNITSLAEDAEGRIWAGTREG